EAVPEAAPASAAVAAARATRARSGAVLTLVDTNAAAARIPAKRLVENGHQRERRAMRIGYLVDLHGGPYDQPVPEPRDADEKMEAMIEEAILAERSGFHSIQIPDRHGRTETYFPGPLQILTILARETEKVAIGSFCTVATLYHPLLVAEQTAVIDNLSRGRAYQ